MSGNKADSRGREMNRSLNGRILRNTLRAFISTDASLGTQEILDRYTERRPVEVFFRQSKDKLAFDRYQVRSSKGIQRYWLLMSLAHLIASDGNANSPLTFPENPLK